MFIRPNDDGLGRLLDSTTSRAHSAQYDTVC